MLKTSQIRVEIAWAAAEAHKLYSNKYVGTTENEYVNRPKYVVFSLSCD